LQSFGSLHVCDFPSLEQFVKPRSDFAGIGRTLFTSRTAFAIFLLGFSQSFGFALVKRKGKTQGTPIAVGVVYDIYC
jgi:hypothetical protein